MSEWVDTSVGEWESGWLFYKIYKVSLDGESQPSDTQRKAGSKGEKPSRQGCTAAAPEER